MQAVGAEDQHVARLQAEGRRVGGDKHLRPDRANENVTGIGGGNFAGGDQAHLALLVDQVWSCVTWRAWPLRTR